MRPLVFSCNHSFLSPPLLLPHPPPPPVPTPQRAFRPFFEPFPFLAVRKHSLNKQMPTFNCCVCCLRIGPRRRLRDMSPVTICTSTNAMAARLGSLVALYCSLAAASATPNFIILFAGNVADLLQARLLSLSLSLSLCVSLHLGVWHSFFCRGREPVRRRHGLLPALQCVRQERLCRRQRDDFHAEARQASIRRRCVHLVVSGRARLRAHPHCISRVLCTAEHQMRCHPCERVTWAWKRFHNLPKSVNKMLSLQMCAAFPVWADGESPFRLCLLFPARVVFSNQPCCYCLLLVGVWVGTCSCIYCHGYDRTGCA